MVASPLPPNRTGGSPASGSPVSVLPRGTGVKLDGICKAKSHAPERIR